MTPDERAQPTTPRTRRSLLAAAAAAGGALATQALVRPSPVAAANVVLGAVNTAAAATTIRSTEATSTAKALIGLVTTGISGPSTAGIQGQSNALNGNGVFGVALAGNSKGVFGRSAYGRGVYGEATATTGANVGVHGKSFSSAGNGVQGEGGTGVIGTGSAFGVIGRGGPTGVRGDGVGDNSNGVYGQGGYAGVFGRSPRSGLYGEGYYGVRGLTTSEYGFGVYGAGPTGVSGTSESGYGVAGYANSGDGIGVYGHSNGPAGCGVRGIVFDASPGASGVRGTAQIASAWAGFFDGKVHVAGTFSSSNKYFHIDHPMDPANKTLTHSCVEAPEMLNVYRGNVTLDAAGRATVRLPGYFRALNADYSYQLTPVGVPAPDLYVSREITARSFAVAGGAPGQKVCWIVTGVRQDAWAQKHPLRVERSKRRKDRGKYLNPEVFGKLKSAAMHPIPKVPRRPRRLPRPKAA